MACGGGEEPAPEPTTGAEVEPDQPMDIDEDIDESIDEEHREPSDEPEAVDTPTGPGRLTVFNRVGTDNVGGTVSVMDLEGEVVAEGASGETFDLPSGQYTLAGTITDPAILIDTPTDQGDDPVTVRPGATTEGLVRHGRARIRLRVRRGNREISQWRLEITRGEETITMRSNGNEYIPVSPGRYNGVLHFGTNQITVNDLIFPDGASRDLPINVN
jgi:hypothetical protein